MELRQRLLNVRIEWCKQLRARTGTREAKEGWLAEEEGLRDALLGRDRSALIRVCYPSQVERYQLGFEDGQALLRFSPSRKVRLHFYKKRKRPNPGQTIGQAGPRFLTGFSANYQQKSR